MGEHSLLSVLENKVLNAIEFINALKEENRVLLEENESLKDAIASHDGKIVELETLVRKAEQEHEEFENLVLSVINNLEKIGVEDTILAAPSPKPSLSKTDISQKKSSTSESADSLKDESSDTFEHGELDLTQSQSTDFEQTNENEFGSEESEVDSDDSFSFLDDSLQEESDT